MLPIKGLQKTSLIDFEPYTSCVVFIGGCNFRCPFCQNKDLVLDIDKQPTMSEDQIFKFLEERKEWLDAVCITGGEPTLYKELQPFIETIKSMGFKVKLDTNGTNPELLKEILPMLDYVAMDIKSTEEKYQNAAKVSVDMENIKRSIEIIRTMDDYEFRTTVVPELMGPDEAKAIGEWLKGSKRFALQQFRTDHGILDESMKKETYCRESMEGFRDMMAPFFDEVVVRG